MRVVHELADVLPAVVVLKVDADVGFGAVEVVAASLAGVQASLLGRQKLLKSKISVVLFSIVSIGKNRKNIGMYSNC